MHVPPAFRLDRSTSLAFASARGFGLVVAHDGERPVASPLPFHLDYRPDGTPRARFHVARSNPLATLAERGGYWLIAVGGSDAYIPATWYVSPDQVPTWLYEAVHLSGRVRALSPAQVREHLDGLVDTFDPPRNEHWSADSVTSGRLSKLMQAIIVIELDIDRVEGSAKLNQTKSDADHVAVVQGLRHLGDAMARQIAQRMVALRPHLDYDTVAKETCDA